MKGKTKINIRFWAINQYLYYRYLENPTIFSGVTRINNKYTFLKLFYGWDTELFDAYEKVRFDYNKRADLWLKRGIPSSLYSEYNSTNYSKCVNHLYGVIHLQSSDSLRSCLYDLFTEPLEDGFEWNKTVEERFLLMLERFSPVKVLASLLIYAQTGTLKEPGIELRLEENVNYLKAYKKNIVNCNFRELFGDAQEINMAQLAWPSMLEKYSDFYKKTNKEVLLYNLMTNNDFKINVMFLDPDIEIADTIVRTFMFGEEFGESVNVIRESIDFAKELMHEFPNRVRCRVVSCPMSYSYFESKRKDGTSIIKIDHYTAMTQCDDRYSFFIRKSDSRELYQYYQSNWKALFYNETISKEVSAE